ncbi:MAG: hypothetical protein BWX86_02359 [Verrucomicrobia bacterium ADurb.Bin122]|nr:MAG: hypothetical protein BWX86_02359 [Verrucomicrobia bacterium ADurb.Bin122]
MLKVADTSLPVASVRVRNTPLTYHFTVPGLRPPQLTCAV